MLSAAAPAAEVSVEARVDKGQPIYAGDAFAYSIVVHGSLQPPQVDLAPLSDYRPRLLRQYPSSMTAIINGRQISQQEYVMEYALTVSNPGRITLPSIDVVAGGRTHRTAPVTITVNEHEEIPQIDISMSASPSDAWVGEGVELTVDFYVWRSLAQADAMANLIFNVPVLESEAFLVEDAAAPSGGNVTNLNVNGEMQPFVQTLEEHEGVECVRVTLRKILIPRRAGELAIESAAVSVDIAVGRRPSRDPFDSFFGGGRQYKRYGKSSDSVTLTVRPLPQEDQPADFYGLVGRYTISASVEPRSVDVGQPITLTIRVGGNPYLRPVQWPDLAAVPHMEEHFKLPDDHSAPIIQNGTKVFTQTLRARHEGVDAVPPIPLTYFDTAQGRYVTVRTDPIPLEVRATPIVTSADVEGGAAPVSSRSQIEAVRAGLSANIEDPAILQNQRFVLAHAVTRPGYLAIWAAPAALLALSAAVRAAGRTDPRRQAQRRRRAALSRARRMLSSAGRLSGQQARLGQAAALKQYVADRFDCQAKSLTPLDCEGIIVDRIGDVELAGRYRRALESLEAGAYAGTRVESSADPGGGVLELLAAVEKKSR